MRDIVRPQGDNGRGWYKPEGYAAFLAETPIPSSSVRYGGARRYHARTWTHSGEPEPDRSWYKPRAKSERPRIVGDKVVNDVDSEANVSGRSVSIARRFYNTLKGYLT